MLVEHRSLVVGLCLLFAHNMLTGWQDVYRAVAFRKLDVFFLTFIAFLIVIATFEVCFRISGGESRLRWRTVISLNLWTAGSWGALFLSIWLIPPALAAAIATSLCPIFTYLVNRRLRPSSPASLRDIAICLAALAITAFLSWATIASDAGKGANGLVLWGIFLAVAAAFSDAFMTVSMKACYDRKVSGSELLARRFYLLTGLAFTGALVRGAFSVSTEELMSGASLAFLGVIPATLLLQRSLKHIEPVLFEIVLATAPAFVLAFQFTHSALTPSTPAIVGVVLVIGLSLVQIYHSFFGARHA
ncbi:hypothetical protein I9018_24720 [Pseudomonas sp. MPFS]|uniref:EamA family transporter n=1 Tax=Pseudomonas sp. MPFS TaxID=2795724 RepID=UPI001F132B20|nr:hypothetical protein [Pseudomonas sp. MPFS]UMZ10662.1 hypothetical protein I9018_24720 [Pseudomonas sp. MPFS]